MYNMEKEKSETSTFVHALWIGRVGLLHFVAICAGKRSFYETKIGAVEKSLFHHFGGIGSSAAYG